MVSSLRETGSWTSFTAASLAGRLNFLKFVCLGRPLTPVMYVVHERAARDGKCRKFTIEKRLHALDAIAMTLPTLSQQSSHSHLLDR
eukprot:5292285-Amphidinium_carterae.1